MGSHSVYDLTFHDMVFGCDCNQFDKFIEVVRSDFSNLRYWRPSHSKLKEDEFRLPSCPSTNASSCPPLPSNTWIVCCRTSSASTVLSHGSYVHSSLAYPTQNINLSMPPALARMPTTLPSSNGSSRCSSSSLCSSAYVYSERQSETQSDSDAARDSDSARDSD